MMCIMCLFVKYLGILSFGFIHSSLEILTGFLEDMLDLRNCNYREEFRKQEEAGKEQAKSSEVESNFPDGWPVVSAPAAGKIIAVDRCNDDHETLEPHTYVYDNRHEEGNGQVSSHLSKPENLWRQYVTTHHEPVAPAIR